MFSTADAVFGIDDTVMGCTTNNFMFQLASDVSLTAKLIKKIILIGSSNKNTVGFVHQ